MKQLDVAWVMHLLKSIGESRCVAHATVAFTGCDVQNLIEFVQ